MVSEDLPQSTSHVKSQLAAALAARGSSDISLCLTSRKRKQSSPQPCRELMAEMAGEQSGIEEATGPGPSKLMKPTSQLETKNSKTTFSYILKNPEELFLNYIELFTKKVIVFFFFFFSQKWEEICKMIKLKLIFRK